MRSTVEITFDKRSVNEFQARCMSAIRNVGRGTKKATIEAAEEILLMSRQQVPRETLTLFKSSFYKVKRRTDTSPNTWAYEAIIGYGGNGDPINPITGRQSSYYMVAVHEGLVANHAVGKAKFLEDPVREYGQEKFARTIFKNARVSLAEWSD